MKKRTITKTLNPLLVFAVSTSIFATTPAIQLAPVVAGSNYGSVFTTTDNGATWQTYLGDPSYSQFNDILWMNNQFVAVGEDYTFLSFDGINWTQAAGNSGHFERVMYGNHLYLASGDAGLASSADGMNWSYVSFPNTSGYDTQFLNGVAWGAGHYVLTGSYVNEDPRKVHTRRSVKDFKDNFPTINFTATSTDAVNWTVYPQTTGFSDVIWSQSLSEFIAVSYDGVIATSPDGVTWTNEQSDPTQWFKRIVYGNGTYVIFGESQNAPYPPIILTSHDAKTWTSQSLPAEGTLSPGQITFKNNQFFVSGTDVGGVGGEVLSSPDGVHWSLRTVQGNIGIYSIG